MRRTILPVHIVGAAVLSLSLARGGEASEFGGFSPDSMQVFFDYIHSKSVVKVTKSTEFRGLVDEIPVVLQSPLNALQESQLRQWTYDFLTVFSSESSDSLVAAFYLRAGYVESRLRLLRKMLRARRGDEEAVPKTAFELVMAGHRSVLKDNSREYFIESVSFDDTRFKVFSISDSYASYYDLAMTSGMLPRGAFGFNPVFRGEVEDTVERKEAVLLVDLMFLLEEPEEFAVGDTPGRTPTFFRLAWDDELSLWREVEAFFSLGVPTMFLYNVI